MASRIGVLVRVHIPLHFNDWRLVPNEYKDIIWNEINVSFYNFIFYIFTYVQSNVNENKIQQYNITLGRGRMSLVYEIQQNNV